MSTDVLVALMGCTAGVVIAVIELKRAPIDEHLRHQIEDLRERLVKLEQKYMAYPTAGSVLHRLSELEIRFNLESESRGNGE